MSEASLECATDNAVFMKSILCGHYREMLARIIAGESLKEATLGAGVVYMSMRRFEARLGLHLSVTACYLRDAPNAPLWEEIYGKMLDELFECEKGYAAKQRAILSATPERIPSKSYGPWQDQIVNYLPRSLV